MIDMANNMKVLSLSTKHRTKAEKARREYEESLIQSDGVDLDDVTASQFVNTTARRGVQQSTLTPAGRNRDLLAI